MTWLADLRMPLLHVFVPNKMSPVDNKKYHCHTPLLRDLLRPCVAHGVKKSPYCCVIFKKWLCRAVDFRGLPPTVVRASPKSVRQCKRASGVT